MNALPEAKPQLHQSHLAMLSRCGEQFRRVYIEGHREPPGVARLIGAVTHQAIKENLQFKIEGKTLSSADVSDLARASFDSIWNEAPLTFTQAEIAEGPDRIKGQAIDTSVALVVAHHRELVPIITPAAGGLERPWVIRCDGYPYDLAGTIDIDEGSRIRDTKTRNKNPGQKEADTSDQLTIYAMVKKIVDGVDIESVILDCLVKGDEARVYSYQSTRGMSDFVVAKNRFERAVEVIEKEAFTPASQSDWWCSARFCGFAADGSCPFYRGKKAFSMAQSPTIKTTVKKGAKHRGSKSIIKANTTEWYDAIR